MERKKFLNSHWVSHQISSGDQSVTPISTPTPPKIVVIHCKRHQKGNEVSEGNRLADQAANNATKLAPTIAPLWDGLATHSRPPYTQEEQQWTKEMGYTYMPIGWLQSEDGRLHLPEGNQWKVLKTLYQASILGGTETLQMAQRIFTGKDIRKTIKKILTFCEVCHRNNPLMHAQTPMGG